MDVTQVDLLGQRAQPTEAMEKLVSENNFFKWFGVSAKTGHNVEEAITALVEEVMQIQGVSGGSKGERYQVVKLGAGGSAAAGEFALTAPPVPTPLFCSSVLPLHSRLCLLPCCLRSAVGGTGVLFS